MFPAKPPHVLGGEALHRYYAQLSEYHSVVGELPFHEKISVWKDPDQSKVEMVAYNMKFKFHEHPWDEITYVWKNDSEDAKMVRLLRYMHRSKPD